MAPTNPKNNNVLPLWGNEKTMNLNNLILTNIQSSHYFKVNLFELKTYHEVIDEIYYKVSHLEPWEKGSRKTSGQTGMCGGVRGVGAGGIVSTAFCLLYKLFTLKLTRKQLNGLITHCDSPFIRALGFMYIRYTQPPADLWDWYEAFLDDEEELDVKAGGGCVMSIGEMLRHYLTKLEWYSTLFPRIPVPIQKDLEKKLSGRPLLKVGNAAAVVKEVVDVSTAGTSITAPPPERRIDKHIPDDEVSWGEAERISRLRRSASRERRVRREDKHDRPEESNGEWRDQPREREEKEKDRGERRHRDRREYDERKENGRSKEHRRHEKHRHKSHHHHRDSHRARSRSPHRHHHKDK